MVSNACGATRASLAEVLRQRAEADDRRNQGTCSYGDLCHFRAK